MSDIKFINGLSVKQAPVDFLCINGSICLEDFGQWCKENGDDIQKSDNGKRYVNFTVKKSKADKVYICLNNYKASKQKAENDFNEQQGEPVPDVQVFKDDVPF
jgi:hypothetical protein